MDSGARNRVRLWLRSEKALGLPSVARPVDAAAPIEPAGQETDAPVAEDPDELTRPAPPPAVPVVMPPTARSAPSPEPAPPPALFAPAADQPAFDAPPLSPEEKRARLVALDDKEVRGCTRCRLCETRTNTVFGEGDPNADIFFIGEGPGENEDLTGRPFVGRAGEMLNKWIAAMGLKREQVFIANIVKCLRYSTLVQLENGSWERIGRLVKQRYGGRVMSVADDGSIVPKRVTGWHTSPLAGRRVFKVSYASSALRGGNRAVAWMTHDHEVLTQRGWVSAQELLSTDEVAVGQGLSRVAYEVTVGTLLGDGTISDKNAYLGFVHCRDQRDYVHWKARALRELSPIVYDSSVRVKSVGREFLTSRCRTLAARSLRVLRRRFYDGQRKKVVPHDLRLTRRILAVWFMDDGHLRVRPGKAPLGEIAAHSFGEEARALLIERLRLDLGIVAYERGSSPGRIHFGVEATRRLSEVVAPFCPPGMRYKLHPNAAAAIPFDATLYEPGVPETLYDRVIVQPIEFSGNDRSFYCLDVEDTHNFVTSGGVVHNCRPPNNRVPAPDEVATCTPYLQRQLEIIRPKVIVTLGLPSAKYMLQSNLSMGKLRGQWHTWRGIKLMPTFHPAYVLRSYNDQTRAAVWSDLKKVMAELNLPIPTPPKRSQ